MADEKAAQLEKITNELQNLTRSPLFEYRQQNNYSPVIGEGNLDAAIMFIGEAPGEQEAKSGRPFVGAAGKVLDELLESIGLRRQNVYITNIVKDRPPENRDPTAEEIQLYQPFLLEQLELIQPKVIVALGRFAMDFLLNQFDLPEKGQKIGALHGKVLKAKASYNEVAVVALYHPATAFYNRNLKDTLKQDFQTLKQFIL
jgi:DNA polymerase